MTDKRLLWRLLIHLCFLDWIVYSQLQPQLQGEDSTVISQNDEKVSFVKCGGYYGEELKSIKIYDVSTSKVLMVYQNEFQNCSYAPYSECKVSGSKSNRSVYLTVMVKFESTESPSLHWFNCTVTKENKNGTLSDSIYSLNIATTNTTSMGKMIRNNTGNELIAEDQEITDETSHVGRRVFSFIVILMSTFFITSLVLALQYYKLRDEISQPEVSDPIEKFQEPASNATLRNPEPIDTKQENIESSEVQNENDYEEDMGSPNNSEELYTDEEAPFEEPPEMDPVEPPPVPEVKPVPEVNPVPEVKPVPEVPKIPVAEVMPSPVVVSWSAAEEEAVLKYFKKQITSGKMPTTDEIMKCQKAEKVLKNRTLQSIQEFLQKSTKK